MFYELSSLKSLMNTNAFISFLSRLPILKNISFEGLYKSVKLKKVISIFGFLYELFNEAVVPSIFTAAIYGLLFNRLKINSVSIKLLSFILLSVVGTKIAKPSFLTHNEDDYIFLNLFSIKSRVYYLNKIFSNLFITTIANFPAIYFVFKDFGIAFKLSLISISFMIFINFVYLRCLKKNEKLPKSIFRTILPAIFIISGIAVIFLRIDLFITTKVFNLITIIFCLVGILSAFYIVGYRNFTTVRRVTASSSAQIVKVSVKTSLNEDNSANLMINEDELRNFYNRNKDLSPAVYIDKAFFTRYRRIFIKNIKGYLSSNLIFFTIYSLLMKFNIINRPDDFIEVSGLSIAIALGFGYSASLLQMCFRNVDRILLKNKILTKEGLYGSLKYRMKILFVSNIVNTMGMVIGFSILIFLNRLDFKFNDFLRTVVCYFVMLVSVDLVEIMFYYLFSPFSTDLNVKSPPYKVLRAISGIIFALFIFKYTNILMIEKYVYIVFILLVMVFLLVKGKFIKTFKLKY